MSLTIKAYLKRGENANPEIRRFTVDHDVTSSYDYLAKKVATVFPSLGRPEKFTMAWKDADDEMVSFSSDEELMEALGALEENIFRIYITEKKKRNQGTAAGAEGEVFHPGVVCDGCEGGIRGPRFKCLVCPDYDLCKECEEKGVHPEHEFVKFRKPVIGRTHSGGFRCRPNMWRGVGHPGWRHWWWQQHHNNPGPWGSHQNKGDNPEQQGQGSPQQGQGQGGCSGTNEGHEKAAEFMQHIGAQVAEMLDPLGIDVDIETSIGGMRRKCYTGENDCARGKGKGRGNGPCGKAKGEKAAAKKGATETQKDEQTTTKATEKMEFESGTTPGEATAKEPTKGDGAASGSDDGEWDMVTEDKPDGKDKEHKESPQVPDSAISSAVELLKAMGFDDDSGWLTHLVEAKAGDINRILDTIRLNQQR